MLTHQQLMEWIEHPELLGKDSLYSLRSLLARYPYFQIVRLLYLKNLFLLHDTSFKEELRKSALYIADLGVLFYYIEGEHFKVKVHPKEEQNEIASDDRTLDLIDRFLMKTEEDMNNELLLPGEIEVDYTSRLMDELEDLPDTDNQMRGQHLIDSFISQNEEGSIPPVEADEQDEDDTENVDQPADWENEENYFTETLAKIYIKQKRYEKALEIIKKLNLKYPKKNTYFADQIRFLEKLIINAKSK